MEPRKFSIFGTNLIIFLIYYVIVVAILAQSDSYMSGIFMWGLGLYVIHAIILFIISVIRLFKGLSKEAAQYALTAFALLIIGFGLCTATFFGGSAFGVRLL